jgi:hypothetical protein
LRSDLWHWPVIPIVAALLLPAMVLRGDVIGPPVSVVPRGAAIAFLGAAIFLMAEAASIRSEIIEAKTGFQILANAGHTAGKSDTELVVDADRPAPQWATIYPNEDELQAVRYLRARTNSTDSIFVGCRDHSRLYLNDIRFYWLAGRPIGVRMFELEPGMATEAGAQREMTLDFKKNDVKWLIIDMTQRHGDPTFEQRPYRGSVLLDGYIRDRFQEKARFGQYAVWTAR